MQHTALCCFTQICFYKKRKNANVTVQISTVAVETVIKVEFTHILFQVLNLAPANKPTPPTRFKYNTETV
jgi:hypothetical protein